MARQRKIIAVDMFAGGGGTSTGLHMAAELLGLKINHTVINHWKIAIETLKLNYPNSKWINHSLENISPEAAIPGGRVDILIAAPECTFHSNARGGKPMNNQSRASAKYVYRWLKALDISCLLLENVPEFENWGPLYSDHSEHCLGSWNMSTGEDCSKGCHFMRPMKHRSGEYFTRFVRSIKKLGYTVEWHTLNAANYGGATTRKRLFMMAVKEGSIVWPDPTHNKDGSSDMFGTYEKWRAARECIDFSVKGTSIFRREEHGKKPLADNTLRRIEAGLVKYSGLPFVIGQQSGATPRSTDSPLPTIAGAGAISLVQPFIVPFFSEREGQLPRTHSIDDPFATVTGQGVGALVEPFIIQMDMGGSEKNIDLPFHTFTSADALALIQPFIVMLNGTSEEAIEQSNRSVDYPLPTLVGSGHIGLVEPCLVEYHGNSDVASINEPFPTQTGRDRFGLMEPIVFKYEGKFYLLDILFRMLMPREMALGMGFPKDYQFFGNREQVVKQIGNAVEVKTARALCYSLLTRKARIQ